MPKQQTCCEQQYRFITTVQVFKEVVEDERGGCGVPLFHKTWVWVLAVQNIASWQRGGCGIHVHTPNVKGCPQNLHSTIKDTIIFPFTKQVQIKALLYLKV